MTRERAGSVLAGRIEVDGAPRDHLPPLTVEAFLAGSSVSVARTTSTVAGEWRLDLCLSPPLSLRIRVVDGRETVLAEADADVAGAGAPFVTTGVPAPALDGAVPVGGAGPPPARLLNRRALAALRARVSELSASGVLPDDAPEVIEGAIQPLEWADSLLEDARGALAGRTDAAERLRAALLSLGIGPELPPAYDPEAGLDGDAPDAERSDELRVVEPDGLVQLAAAAAWAVESHDEAQSMLNAIAALLWSQSWLELLVRAAATGNAPAMRPLMGAPGPGWGPPPGWSPQKPGGPGLPPGWGKIPIPGKGRLPVGAVVGKVPDLTIPINLMPSERQKCLVAAVVTVARRRRALPQYEIRAMDPADACPGAVVALTGVNFGTGGQVVFPGLGDGVRADQVLQWTDTLIRVRVPAGAAPGQVRLSIYEGTLALCGRLWPIYRPGTTLPLFQGGVPAIFDFRVEGSSTEVAVEPGESVGATYATSTGAGVVASLTVTRGADVVFATGDVPGGFGTVTFVAPKATSPVDLIAELRVRNHCGDSRQRVTLVVVRQPRLKILRTEVTQAIQRLDNTVRLAARRRTMVRVYLDSGLGDFSFTAGNSALPGVTGTVTIWRGGQALATVPPLNAPFTTVTTLFPYARHGFGTSLNFLLPFEHLSGDVQLQVAIRLETPPRGVASGPGTRAVHTENATFAPLAGLSLVRIMLADGWRGLPAPTVAEWQTALQGAQARFPVADDGWSIRIHPGYTVVTVDCDLSTDDGWDELLEELDDVAGDSKDSWAHRWVGLLPAHRAGVDTFGMRGMARTETDDGLFSNDYMVMACVAGRPEVFAHELGHTFGIDHAGCPPGGAGMPKDIDYALPLFIDQTGVDLYAMAIVAEWTTGELMGYCAANGLWPSVTTWERFMGALD